jgi:putative Holliday junction resolvase
MKYLGIDFGLKRVGLAISNEEGTFAFPREVVPNDDQLTERILTFVKDEHIGAIVVGDTRAASGAPNIASLSADLFIEELKAATPVAIHRGFEAWSSMEAARFAPKGQKHNDASAAAIILQRFLDKQ